MTPQAALILYRKACESHRRQDWRQAAHAMAEALGQPTAAKPAKPVSLVAFLAKDGLADEGGEVTARDGDIWHKGRAFQRRLVREGGRTLEAAAEAAHEAGYFPHAKVPAMDGADNMHPVTGAELIEAIDRELAGRPVYAGEYDDALPDSWEPEREVA